MATADIPKGIRVKEFGEPSVMKIDALPEWPELKDHQVSVQQHLARV